MRFRRASHDDIDSVLFIIIAARDQWFQRAMDNGRAIGEEQRGHDAIGSAG